MEEHSVEKSFQELEELITKLEGSDISLEESFGLYKKGLEELEYCSKKIEETKKAVMAINADGNLEVFEGED